MTEACKIRILAGNAPACEANLEEPLELGRQRAGEPPPYQSLPAADNNPARLIIAPQHDKDNISRRHLALTPLAGGLVRVSNHSQAPLDLDEDALPPGGTVERMPPFSLTLPGRTIRVLPPASRDHHGVHSLDEPTRGPGIASDLSLSSHSLALLQPAQM